MSHSTVLDQFLQFTFVDKSRLYFLTIWCYLRSTSRAPSPKSVKEYQALWIWHWKKTVWETSQTGHWQTSLAAVLSHLPPFIPFVWNRATFYFTSVSVALLHDGGAIIHLAGAIQNVLITVVIDNTFFFHCKSNLERVIITVITVKKEG